LSATEIVAEKLSAFEFSSDIYRKPPARRHQASATKTDIAQKHELRDTAHREAHEGRYSPIVQTEWTRKVSGRLSRHVSGKVDCVLKEDPTDFPLSLAPLNAGRICCPPQAGSSPPNSAAYRRPEYALSLRSKRRRYPEPRAANSYDCLSS